MGARCTSDRPNWQGGAGAFALALLVILLIALAQRSGALDAVNRSGMALAGRLRDAPANAWLTPVMQAASTMGGTAGRLIILSLALAVLLGKRQWRDAGWAALVVMGGMLLNSGIKHLFAAPRPDLLPHLDIVNSYSFPSGHSAGAMVLFGALAMLCRGRFAWGGAVILTLTIGLSRIWLGVHWPTDVLAGWIEGLGWLALLRYWLPGRRAQRSVMQRRTPPRR